VDFIGLFFVGSTVSLMAAHLIEALIGRRPDHEEMGREFGAQPWGTRASATLRMRSASASMRMRRRRRLRPSVLKQFETAQQASKPATAGEEMMRN
jgi:hypothetical protein